MKKLLIALGACLSVSVAAASETETKTEASAEATAFVKLAEDAFHLVMTYDKDGDGVVSSDEFTAGNFEQMLAHDADGNKEISAEEYLNAETARIDVLSKDNPKGKELLMQVHEMSKQTMPMIYQSFDGDKSGGLTQEEFNPLLVMSFQQNDINQDGKIDKQDLEAMHKMAEQAQQ